ncbi:MAG: hypothetical protein HY000_40065 [Planctomycetes bacterium]|nr:hypothetical protein [Planctomycetota bacterium]
MPTKAGMDRHRESLLRRVTASTLEWHPVTLGTAGKVLVCQPVRIDDYFVPVTPLETFAKARAFGAFPLTRAVADQAHLQAVQIVPRPEKVLWDFYASSERLMGTFYRGKPLVSGAHKIWLLSGRGIGINYGFYLEKKLRDVKERFGQYLDKDRGGTFLPRTDFTLIQGSGAAHDVNLNNQQIAKALAPDFADRDSKEDSSHWDYSQLLQLMKQDGPLEIDGKSISLVDALVEGLSPVWDEQPLKPHPKALKLLGLEPAKPKQAQEARSSLWSVLRGVSK